MQTEHVTAVGDARDLALADDAIGPVVTSPPYPMIERWDDLFADLDPAIGDHLEVRAIAGLLFAQPVSGT